ncbi:MAG TPA: hypothetical protein PK372_07865 [Rugosibacter sp.]|nr:hypothetical protein [Rugosibacter sp.]HQN47664.1 hypothetical protein [Rugosibacter sp.]HQQ35825.1 hypothetical protein [Rugosibacter sp.]
MSITQLSNQVDSSRAALESIDHLTKKICALWGSPELNIFVRELIFDSRDGSRQGFPIEIAAELVFLAETNVMVRAIRLAKRLNIPFGEACKKIEAEDSLPVKVDSFSSPTVSRTPVTQKARTAQEKTGSRADEPLSLFHILTNKWLWAMIFAGASYRYLWPWFSATYL